MRFGIEKEIQSRKVIKTEIKNKIKLIYNSKCKSNAKESYIRMETRNLIQSHARNDSINRQIRGFSFCDFKNKVWRSRYDFFRFFQPILDFKHSLDAEMSLEELEIK